MNLPIGLVVFDIAGTTVKDNGEITIAFQEAMKQAGYEVPAERINPLMGYKKTEAIRLLLEVFEENADKIGKKLINRIHQEFLDRMIAHYTITETLTPLSNVEYVFAELKNQGIKIGLNTGFSNDITEVILGRLGWLSSGVVDCVISSNQVPAGRPLPFMIEELMRQANITNPKQVIKVGDTEVDVFEGRNAGCLYAVAVTTGAFSREELEAYTPSFIIDDMKELLPIISTEKTLYAVL